MPDNRPKEARVGLGYAPPSTGNVPSDSHGIHGKFTISQQSRNTRLVLSL